MALSVFLKVIHLVTESYHAAATGTLWRALLAQTRSAPAAMTLLSPARASATVGAVRGE